MSRGAGASWLTPGLGWLPGAEPVRHAGKGTSCPQSTTSSARCPADQISQQVGASPDEVRTCAAAVLPALLGGLQANAGDPSGAGSILQALGQHDDDLLTGGADLSAIDEQDGTAIASHIFGDQQDEVVNRLGGLPAVGGSGLGGALVKKLLPILAPMVLSWLANRVLKGGGGGPRWRHRGASPPTPRPRCRAAVAAARPARSTTCCATCSAARPAGRSAAIGRLGLRRPAAGRRRGFDPGSIIGDVLGGILGGGRR